MLETVRLIFAGLIVGVANIIPGVSGGTMAVIFNLYDRIVNCTKKGNLKKSLPFLLKIGIGALIGILGFARLIKWLYLVYPVATKLCFAGLIFGSIPLILRHAMAHCRTEKGHRVPISAVLSFLVMFAAMTALAFLKRPENDVIPFSWWLCILMIFAGVLSAVAMVLPGISGSLLMSAIGMYQTMMSALGGLTNFSAGTAVFLQNLLLSLCMLIGCTSGIVLGLNGVRILLEKVPSQTYFGILGLVIGSVFSILPLGCAVDAQFWVGIVILCLSAVGAYLFSRTEK